MQIVQVSVDKLTPATYNPRKIKPQDFEQIKKSIQEFGFVQPIVANSAAGREGVIIGGHQRFDVAKKIGIKEVPVFYVDIPDIEREKELNIRLNKNQGEFDFEILQNNFSIDGLLDFGFEMKEINLHFDFSTVKEMCSVPETPKEPRAKHGEIYTLGRHRLMCGDSTLKKDLDKLMSNTLADTLITDPPYGVDYSSKNEFLNAQDEGNRIQTPIENDAIKNYKEWFGKFLNILPLADYNTVYIFMSGQELHSLRLAAEEAGIKWGDYLIWVKNNHVLGRKDYNAKHEFIFYGWKKHHKFYDSHSTTVLEFPKPTKSELHPTMKPIDLIVKLINGGTSNDGNVLDLFGGSGSTLIACEMTKRNCFMMEFSPNYVDVIIKRYCNFTASNEEEIYASAKGALA